jgi:hypothetical protein
VDAPLTQAFLRQGSTAQASPHGRKEVNHVHLHPHLASQLASERRRDMLARAQQQCRARQATALARAARPSKQAERRMGRAVRTALRLAGLEQ